MKFKSNIEIQAGLEDAGGSPGTVNQLLSSTVTGTAWIDPSTIVAEAATLVVIACKNTSGAAIAQGTPVYQTGTVGATATIEIAPADALISANKLPAIGLLQTALNNNGFGFVVITGELTNFTTSPIDGVVPTTGDKVFVKSGGGLTLTKPTGEGNGIQNMGLVGKVSVGNSGSITVSSIMRTNDVPNLPEGRIWIGDGNTIVSDTVYVDEPNNKVGIGTTSPSTKLHVSGGDIRIDDTERIEFGSGGVRINNDAAGRMYYRAPLGFYWETNGGYRMVINSTGNVGIGTTSPGTYRLAVAGSTAIGENLEVSDGLGGDKTLSIDATIGAFQIGDIDGIGDQAYIEGDSSNIKIFTGGVEKVRVNLSGNVGMGTTNLTTISAAVTTLSLGSTVATTSGGIAFQVSGGVVKAYNYVAGNYLYSQTAPGVGQIFYGAGSEQMRIHNTTGNVGIGTTSPLAKLQVDGNANIGLLHTNFAGASFNVNLGFENYNNGFAAIATGQNTLADASQSFSMGFQSKATGAASLAGGNVNPITALPSESAGEASIAFGNGVKTNSNANYSQAFGRGTETGGGLTSANQAMAMGFNSIAFGDNSFSGGNNSRAFGEESFAFGAGATASKGDGNIALGIGVTTPNFGSGAYGPGQVAVGTYNVYGTGQPLSFSVGNGFSDSQRLTALCVNRNTGNTGMGNVFNPQSKLQVNGGIQLANDVAAASAAKVGTFKYYKSGNNSYVDMCMQTGASTYAWVNIVTNSW